VSALVVIGGTTASGKTALAVEVARRLGAVVVNADALQLYRDLPILTARPGPGEQQGVPHHLFGVLGPHETASTGSWLAAVAPFLELSARGGAPVVLVGGTGLYIRALLQGMAPVPEIPPAVREAVRRLAASVPPVALHARLAAEDPVMASRLRPSDPQRIARALEVVRATGRSLAAWQADPPVRPVLPPVVTGIALLPPPATRARLIRQRLERMVAAGALDELDALRRRLGGATAPVFRTLGAAELLRHLDGAHDLETALETAATATRRYAKRQSTFFRHQLPMLEPFAAIADGDTLDRLARRLVDGCAAAIGR
jgi:tRNA dimethylallyltransferase